MKLNKKGFTLIEILAIVVLIGVVAVMAIPNVTKQADDHAAKQTKLVKEQITNAAKMYFSDDSERIKVLFNTRCNNYNGNGSRHECEVSIDTLIEKELLSLGNNSSSSFEKIYINKTGGKLYYKIK